MKAAAELIRRMQEDAGFRQQVNACLEGEERLAWLKSEGYDFSPFVQILNNLSDGQQAAGGLGPPKPGASGFFSRLSRIFLASKVPGPNRQSGSCGQGESGSRVSHPVQGRKAGKTVWGLHDPGFRPSRPGP